jgi:FemAB-related protein (PEP-CTERM system-associated)
MNTKNSVSIHEYTEEDKATWDAYVMNRSDGTLFHLTSWKVAIERTFGHKSIYLMAVRDKKTDSNESISCISSSENLKKKSTNSVNCTNEIVGIIPLFRIKIFLFSDFLTSLPFAEIGGILADNEVVAEKLFDRAAEITQKFQCDYLELRNRKPAFELPIKSLYYKFSREIFSDPDENMKAIPRKARRMVRQGIKFGLRSEIGNHLLNDFYEILAKSYHSLGTPIFPIKLFKNLIEVFNNDIQILLIRNKEKTPIAGVLTFFFKDHVMPYYAGSIFEYRKLAPNDFMYWELMRYGCENGYKVFDYGRSKIGTGSYHFKRHWGFEPVLLPYQYHLVKSNEIPDQSPANPKYQKKIELWRKLPFTVTKILGPPIARYLA